MGVTVTVIGGGTGSFNVLTGLSLHRELRINSIVTMMDSGGDSGRLRDEFGVLPPGDIRRCLVALSEESKLLRDLFSFRFADPPLEGRSFGNLLFLALTKTLGSEKEAVEAISGILNIRGRVIAVTWDDVHLCAELVDGTVVVGEANIDVPAHNPSIPIARVHLAPRARANPDALEAISKSDFIVFAPGDLFSSIVPNLLVEGIAEALQRTRAPLIYVLNLMTKHGETDGYTASQHVAQIVRYAKRVPEAVLAHEGPIPKKLVAAYDAEKAHQVIVDADQLFDIGVNVLKRESLMCPTSFVRHDPGQTASALVELFSELSLKKITPPELADPPLGKNRLKVNN